MKRFLLFIMFANTICNNATANTCRTDYDAYSACKPGYYLNNGNCDQCPVWSGVFTNPARTITARGTSKDSNTGSITSCYMHATGPYYDAAGTFNFTANCNYTL